MSASYRSDYSKSTNHKYPYSLTRHSDLKRPSFTKPLQTAIKGPSPCLLVFIIFTLLGSVTSNGYGQLKFQLMGLNGTNGYTVNGIEANDVIGEALAVGDINGDGIMDMIIGAAGADPDGNTNVGETYVVFGKSGNLSNPFELANLDGNNGFMIKGFSGILYSGTSVATGDINGDNIDDVIIGAYGSLSGDPNGRGSGQTYVVFGQNTGFPTSIDLSNLDGNNGFEINGVNAFDNNGSAVSAGDINGDSIDDVITASVSAGNGEVYVVFGKNSGFNASLELSTLNGNNGFTLNGLEFNVSGRIEVSNGDFNNDGIDDVIIGDPNDADGTGKGYIVFGQSSDFSSAINLSTLDGSDGFEIEGIALNFSTGSDVSSGDINGDGIADAIISAEGANPNSSRSGQTYVIYGKTTAFSDSLNLADLDGNNGFVVNGEAFNDFSGRSVAAGDVNSDGIDDLLIGATGVNVGPTTYVVFGKNTGFNATFELSSLDGSSGFRLQGDGNSQAGTEVAAGDINDDGIEDVIIGAPYFDVIYVFNNVMYSEITGTEGFRTLSAPISGSVFDELLDPFWTQGFTGSDAPGAPSANVWVWDETLNTNEQFTDGVANAGDWVALSDQNNDILNPGQGYLHYIYNDNDFDGTPDGFPKTKKTLMYGENPINTGPVNPISTLQDERFFLAGNPFMQAIDWDLITSADQSNLSSTIYVYDHAISAWRSWNRTTGDLTDGLIAPFQGFFVRHDGFSGNGSLTIRETDISSDSGILHKQQLQEPIVLKLELRNGDFTNSAWIQFDERSRPGQDHLDGLELQPLASDYIQLYSKNADGQPVNINVLPLQDQTEIPLQMLKVEKGAQTGGEAVLSIYGLDKLTSNWHLKLVDTKSNEELLLSSAIEYQVTIEADSKQKMTSVSHPVPIMQKTTNSARYLIRITSTQEIEKNNLPNTVALAQNYPNPFNPFTVISYDVPKLSEVTLHVFDMLGRQVATLVNSRHSAGTYEVSFDATNLASGMYMYQLIVDSEVLTKKMMLIK